MFTVLNTILSYNISCLLNIANSKSLLDNLHIKINYKRNSKKAYRKISNLLNIKYEDAVWLQRLSNWENDVSVQKWLISSVQRPIMAIVKFIWSFGPFINLVVLFCCFLLFTIPEHLLIFGVVRVFLISLGIVITIDESFIFLSFYRK